MHHDGGMPAPGREPLRRLPDWGLLWGGLALHAPLRHVRGRRFGPDRNDRWARQPGRGRLLRARRAGRTVGDNQEGDQDPADGVVAVEKIGVGDYVVRETTVPDGYEGAAHQRVTVHLAQTVRVSVINKPPPGVVIVLENTGPSDIT